MAGKINLFRIWGDFIMNILILGNGFDLAHNLPTTYSDFLAFLLLVEKSKPFCLLSASDIDSAKISPEVKHYVQDLLLTQDILADEPYSIPPLIQELYTCLNYNIWYHYFQQKHQDNTIRGINWIDFENEIRNIIEFLDRITDDIYAPVPPLTVNVPESITRFISIGSEYQQLSNGDDCPFRFVDLINRSYHDLQRLVRCLEIYLCDCVNKIDINHVSPDIQALDIDAILTFNYTNTLTRVYSPKGAIEFHHIHGRALPNGSPENNSIVLGVNEYWNVEDADTHTNWNLYKKFTQRIIKETGITYKNG